MPASPHRRWIAVCALLGAGAAAWLLTNPTITPANATTSHADTALSESQDAHGDHARHDHSHAPTPATLASDAQPSASTPAPADASLVRTVETRLDQPLMELAQQRVSAAHPLRVRLALRPGQDFYFLAKEHEKLGADQGVFTGEIEGHAGTLVVLSYVGLAQAGTVQLPDEARAFRIRGRDDGSVRIDEVNLALAPECANCLAAQSGSEPHTHH